MSETEPEKVETLEDGLSGDILKVVVDGQSVTLTKGENTCNVCGGKVTILSEEEASGAFVDQRLTCLECRDVLTTNFLARNQVCINVLCRRKWKQLTPRILLYFCPACRKSLDIMFRAKDKDMKDITFLKRLHEYWISVVSDLSASLNIDWDEEAALALLNEPPPNESHNLLEHARDVFLETFKEGEIAVDLCRAWNSMLVRKKCYRGTVKKKHPKSRMCELAADVELIGSPEKDNVREAETEKSGFYTLDWKDEYAEGQVLYFIAFPNPVLIDGDFVHVIVKVIQESEAVGANVKTLKSKKTTAEDVTVKTPKNKKEADGEAPPKGKKNDDELMLKTPKNAPPKGKKVAENGGLKSPTGVPARAKNKKELKSQKTPRADSLRRSPQSTIYASSMSSEWNPEMLYSDVPSTYHWQSQMLHAQATQYAAACAAYYMQQYTSMMFGASLPPSPWSPFGPTPPMLSRDQSWDDQLYRSHRPFEHDTDEMGRSASSSQDASHRSRDRSKPKPKKASNLSESVPAFHGAGSTPPLPENEAVDDFPDDIRERLANFPPPGLSKQ